MLSQEKIKAILLATGYTVKDGCTDLKDYVYEGAASIQSELLKALVPKQSKHFMTILCMLVEQSILNSRIDSNWLLSGNDYLLAAGKEASEAIDYLGWEWWKKTEVNETQLQLEVVDMWHFLMSAIIVESNGNLIKATEFILDSLAQRKTLYFNDKNYSIHDMSLLKQLRIFSALCFSDDIRLPLFYGIVQTSGIGTIGELAKLFYGKMALNKFRQDNGYKQGTYKKTWFGQEDNVYLYKLLLELQFNSLDASIIKIIYDELANAYKTV